MSERAYPSLVETGEPSKNGKVRLEVNGQELEVSNVDKVLWPETGFTKGDLIDYYAAIGPTVVPHLKDRPLSLRRFPSGVDTKGFWETQCPDHRPDWVQTVPVKVGDAKHGWETHQYCAANDVQTLVWLANLADVELHASLAKAETRMSPDFLAFDLDPGPPADIVDCCEAAILIRATFKQFGMEAYPKTSGSKGMQVYVPLNSGESYEVTKPFAHTLAKGFEERMPEKFVSRMLKKLRKGKILIDWSQNHVHKTTVCVYSMRAKPVPSVSTPLTWEEVQACFEGKDAEMLRFGPDDVLRRVERHGDLFEPVLTTEQKMPG